MTRKKLKAILPYAGLPILCTAMLVIYINRIDLFVLFLSELIICFGYVGSVIDIKEKKVPNSLVLAMFGGWVLTMVPKLFLDTDAALLLLKDSILGFAIGGGLFFLVYLISRKGLGGGDVKYMAAAGLYIGFAGILSAMLYGTLLAALIGIALLLMKKIGRKDSMPLVPFLYVGILISVFYR